MFFFDLQTNQPIFSKTGSLPEYINNFSNYCVNKYKLISVYKTPMKLFYKQNQRVQKK